MKMQMRGKRFLAAFLAFVLAFTSMNFNAAAYADEIEEPAAEVNEVFDEQVDEQTSDDGLVKKGEPGGATYSLRLSNCDDFTEGNESTVKFEYLVDENYVEADLQTATWTTLYTGNRVDIPADKSVYVRVVLGEGQTLYSGEVRNGYDAGEGSPALAALSAEDISALTGATGIKYTPTGEEYVNLEFEHLSLTDNGGGQGGNEPGGQGGDPVPPEEKLVVSLTDGGEAIEENYSVFKEENKSVDIFVAADCDQTDSFTLGWWAGYLDENQSLDDIEAFTDSQEGISFTANADGTAKITIPEVYDFDATFQSDILWIYVGYNYNPEGAEPYTNSVWFPIHVRKSQKGLGIHDWLQNYSPEDLSGIELGEDGKYYYSKSISRTVNDYTAVLFGVCEEDEALEDGSNITPVTEGLTVKKEVDGKWTASNDITLEYAGNRAGDPEKFAGLWLLEFKARGDYRIYDKDGNYVSVTVYGRDWGIYSDKNLTDASLIRDIALGEGDATKVYLAVNGNAAEPVDGKVAKLLYVKLNEETYEWNETEGKFSPELSEDYFTVKKLADGKYELSFGFERDYWFEAYAALEGDESNPYCEGMFVSQSYEGLVVNETIMFEEDFWGEVPTDFDYPEEYRKSFSMNDDETRWFGIGLNNGKQSAYDGATVTPVTSLSLLKLEKFDGEKYVKATDASLKYIAKNVFSFEGQEGEYRVTYNKSKDKYNGTCFYIYVSRQQFGFYSVSGNEATKLDVNRELTADEAFDNRMSFYAFIPNKFDDYDCTGEIYVHYYDRDCKVYGEYTDSNSYVNASEDSGVTVEGFDGKFIRIDVNAEDEFLPDFFFEMRIFINGDEWGYRPLGIQPIEVTNEDFESDIEIPYSGRRHNADDIWQYMCDEEMSIKLMGKDLTLGGSAPIYYENIPYTDKIGTYSGKLGFWGNFAGIVDFKYDVVKATVADWFEGEFGTNSTCFFLDPETCKIAVNSYLSLNAWPYGYATACPDLKFNTDIVYVEGTEEGTYVPVNGDGKLTKEYFEEDPARFEEDYFIKITGQNNVEGEYYLWITYLAKNQIWGTVANGYVRYIEYTGAPVNNDELIPLILKDGNYVLKEDVDYTVEYSEKAYDWNYGYVDCDWTSVNVDGGSYQVNIIGKGFYEGEDGRLQVFVTPADISKKTLLYNDGTEDKPVPAAIDFSAFDVSAGDFTNVFKVYDGTKKLKGISSDAPSVKVLAGKVRECPPGYDYVITFNAGAGKQTLTIEGVGNYKGMITKTIDVKAIKALTSKNLKLKEAIAAVTYTGQPLTPDFELTYTDDKETTAFAKENVDITYSNNVNPGKATITVTGKPEEGYSGTVKYTFKINKAVIGTDVWVCMDTTSMYSPKGAKANIYLDDISGGEDLGVYETLVEGKDYKVTCKNNNKVTTETSKASYTITGIGNFTGTLTDKYDIGAKDVYVVVDELPQEYIVDSSNDATAYATINFKLTDLGVTLKKDVDYTWELAGEYADGLVVEDKSDKSGNTLKFKGSATGNEYRINFSGKGNYVGFSTYEFVVKDYSKKDISDKSKYSVEFTDAAAAAAGIEFYPAEQRLAVKVKDVSSGEEVPTDFYHVDYYDAFNAGTASVVVTGDPGYGYCGSVTLNYKITPMKVDSMALFGDFAGDGLAYEFINDVDRAASINDKGKLVYEPFSVEYVYDDGEEVYYLENKKDYTIKYIKPQAIHGADVVAEFTFKGNLTGKVTVNMGPVMGIFVSSEYGTYEVSGIKDLTYTGKSLKQNITVKDPINKLTFKQGKEISVKYYKADEWGGFDFDAPLTEITEAGTYALSYSIKSKYALNVYYSAIPDPLSDGSLVACKGDSILTFNVNPANISKASVKLANTKFEYEYNDVSAGQGYEAGITSVKLGKTTLEEGKDYQVTYTDNKKPGTATAVIEGLGNYAGFTNKTYTIDGKVDINTCEVYVGKEASFGPSAYPYVEISYNNEVLVYGKDYTLSATDNKKTFEESGKISYLTIKGKGKYTGTLDKKYPFKVMPGDLFTLYRDGRFTIKNGVHEEGFTTFIATYTGKEIKADPKVYVDGKALKLNKDYSLSYINLENHVVSKSVVDASCYYVLISGMGNYTGCVGDDSCGLLVLPADAAKMKVKTANRAYTSYGIFDSVVSVTYGGKTLVEGTDYEVEYERAMEMIPARDDDYIEIGSMTLEAEYYEFCTGKKAYIVHDNDVLGYSKYNRPYNLNLSAGKTVAFVVGKGNYTGLKEAVYTIKGYDMAKTKATIATWDMQELVVNMMLSEGDLSIPEYSVTYKLDDEHSISLEMYEDFYISEINGKNVENLGGGINETMAAFKNGSNTLTLVGMGRFSGTTKVKMNVKSAVLSDMFEPLDILYPVAYNPNGATVSLWYAETGYRQDFLPISGSVPLYNMLEESSEYKVTYSNNKALGKCDSKKAPTMKLSINSSMVSGTISGTFDIIEADVARYTTLSAPAVKSSLDKNGFVKTYKSAPVVKYFDYDGVGYTNTKLKSGRDYTVAYTYATDTKVFDGKNYVIREAGTAIGSKDKLLPGTSIVVTITGKGNYKGSNSAVYTVTEK